MVLLVPALVVDGLSIKALWWWFAVPVGVRGLGLAESIGMGLLIAALTPFVVRREDAEDDPPKVWATRVAHMYLRPLVLLGIGWVVHAVAGAP